MDQAAEVLAAEFGVSREDEDAFALASHRKALAAQAAGAFDAELVPVTVDDRSGEALTADEGPRTDTTLESLARQKPVFKAGGTCPPGIHRRLTTAPPPCCWQPSRRWNATASFPSPALAASAVAGVEPDRMGIGPVPAMDKALGAPGGTSTIWTTVELNEAFAAQSLAVLRRLALDEARVNPNGGAIALGHPLGCSGARLLTTLVHGLHSRPVGTRVAANMCIGVGQGIACPVERV